MKGTVCLNFDGTPHVMASNYPIKRRRDYALYDTFNTHHSITSHVLFTARLGTTCDLQLRLSLKVVCDYRRTLYCVSWSEASCALKGAELSYQDLCDYLMVNDSCFVFSEDVDSELLRVAMHIIWWLNTRRLSPMARLQALTMISSGLSSRASDSARSSDSRSPLT